MDRSALAKRVVAAAHMAMSMLRSSTAVSVTYTAVTPQAATGELVELRAHSK